MLVQRKEQRNTPQAARPSLRYGSASGPGIFVRQILVPYENAVNHDGALRVLPSPLAVPHGDPKATSKAKARVGPSDAAPGAPEVRQSQRVKPRRGAAHGCAAFSAGAGCPVRKFPLGLRTRRAAVGGPPGGVSFAYFSLHKQRKVRPPRPAAPCVSKKDSSREAIKTKAITDAAEIECGAKKRASLPLTPTLCRRERGFMGRAQRSSNLSASSIAGNRSRCATNPSAEIVVVTTPSPAGNSTTGCPSMSITALSPL